ncbi:MAG: hypothetical protein LH628_15555 [Microcoleus sp. CAN_BIN18]|nr:hypothetical protein [Microcoleus sp. CAN_BIN18]
MRFEIEFKGGRGRSNKAVETKELPSDLRQQKSRFSKQSLLLLSLFECHFGAIGSLDLRFEFKGGRGRSNKAVQTRTDVDNWRQQRAILPKQSMFASLFECQCLSFRCVNS